jgi:hypothetical protein
MTNSTIRVIDGHTITVLQGAIPVRTLREFKKPEMVIDNATRFALKVGQSRNFESKQGFKAGRSRAKDTSLPVRRGRPAKPVMISTFNEN